MLVVRVDRTTRDDHKRGCRVVEFTARAGAEGKGGEMSAEKKWIVGQPGGMNGPFYSVIKPNGNIVAMQIPDREMAELIARIPEFLRLEQERKAKESER